MKPDIQEKLITPGADRGRSGKTLTPEGVIIHYVGNAGSSAIANRNYFENGSGGNKVSAHYIVGLKGEIIRCVPENERAHAGKSYGVEWRETSKTNNARFIGIEVCHPDAGGKFSPVTFRALVGLVADICVRHGFDPFFHVSRHYDVTGKSCPLYYVRNQPEWNRLRNAVFAGILVHKCQLMGLPYDPPYWERVMSGEILAEYDYLCILEDRVASAAASGPSIKNLYDMMALGVIDVPEYWESLRIEHFAELLAKAVSPCILYARIENGINDLETALTVLVDAGVLNTPDYWRAVAGNIERFPELLINMANRARIVLEKIIHAEARGESFEGQVLVGNVIMNRCKSKAFPDGIYNVVFQPGQFTPVTDGAYKIAAPSASVKKAADAVLAGHDNSQGALFFCTRASAARNNWHERALTFLLECGNHRFYR